MASLGKAIRSNFSRIWNSLGFPPRPAGQIIDTIYSASDDSPVFKAVIPKFLYKPPYGYPRFVDIPEIRRLAQTPFIDMCITTIVDEIAALNWDIVPRFENAPKSEINKTKAFFDNPSPNKENFEEQIRTIVRDILEIDSGVWEKVFDMNGNFKYLIPRDGGTFTKNPDLFGTFYNSAEFVSPFFNPNLITDSQAYDDWLKGQEQRPAYFQYGWITGARPMPFGTREIVYLMRNPRADSIYGRSPVEILLDVIQMLVYGIDYNLEYFTNNNIPKGVFGMINANMDQIKAFKEQWKTQTKIKNEVGDWRKAWWKMPVINVDGKFEKIQFSNADLELIAQQQWFTKIVWACFGVTPSELGFTESSNRATEIIQSKVFRRKAIRPILRILEYHINSEIIWPEFSELVKFQFDTYDIEEDLERHRLFEIQLKNGIRTKNEVREDLGLKPIDGGDQLKESRSFNPFFQEQMIKSKSMNTINNSVLFPKENEKIKFDNMIKKKLVVIRDTIFTKLEQLSPGTETLSNIKAIDKTTIERILSIVGINIGKETVRDVISEYFIKAIEKSEREMNMNFVPNKKTIDFLTGYTFDNINDMSDEMKNDLRQELERGIMNGESIAKMKSRVSKVIDGSKTRAEKIARTEINRAENQGHLEAYKQSGIKGKKKWVSQIDSKTSEACKRLNGKTIGLNQKFKYNDWEGQAPPAHVNCRSRIVFIPEE